MRNQIDWWATLWQINEIAHCIERVIADVTGIMQNELARIAVQTEHREQHVMLQMGSMI